MANPISVNYFQRTSVERKARVREFYRGVLGWELNEINTGLDIFSCSDEITYGIRYLPADRIALTDEQYRLAPPAARSLSAERPPAG